MRYLDQAEELARKAVRIRTNAKPGAVHDGTRALAEAAQRDLDHLWPLLADQPYVRALLARDLASALDRLREADETTRPARTPEETR